MAKKTMIGCFGLQIGNQRKYPPEMNGCRRLIIYVEWIKYQVGSNSEKVKKRWRINLSHVGKILWLTGGGGVIQVGMWDNKY